MSHKKHKNTLFYTKHFENIVAKLIINTPIFKYNQKDSKTISYILLKK